MCVKILFYRHYFSPLNTSMRKGKDPEPDPYLRLMNPNPDPGGPNTFPFTCGKGDRILVSSERHRSNSSNAILLSQVLCQLIKKPLTFFSLTDTSQRYSDSQRESSLSSPCVADVYILHRACLHWLIGGRARGVAWNL